MVGFEDYLSDVGLKYGSGLTAAQMSEFFNEVAARIPETQKKIGHAGYVYKDRRQDDAKARVEYELLLLTFFDVAYEKLRETSHSGTARDLVGDPADWIFSNPHPRNSFPRRAIVEA